jgi:hypothetical protein
VSSDNVTNALTRIPPASETLTALPYNARSSAQCLSAVSKPSTLQAQLPGNEPNPPSAAALVELDEAGFLLPGSREQAMLVENGLRHALDFAVAQSFF